jgi:hypothetical protein
MRHTQVEDVERGRALSRHHRGALQRLHDEGVNAEIRRGSPVREAAFHDLTGSINRYDLTHVIHAEFPAQWAQLRQHWNLPDYLIMWLGLPSNAEHAKLGAGEAVTSFARAARCHPIRTLERVIRLYHASVISFRPLSGLPLPQLGGGILSLQQNQDLLNDASERAAEELLQRSRVLRSLLLHHMVLRMMEEDKNQL